MKYSLDYKVVQEMNKIDLFIANRFYQKFVKLYNNKHKKEFFTEFDQENYFIDRFETLKKYKALNFKKYCKYSMTTKK